MGLLELILIAIGLAMDAFAVSICKGLNMRKMNYRQAGIIALFFGGFQAIMPLIGWFLGKQFESYITSIDHWIAFLLLAFIGVNMIREALGDDEEDDETDGDKDRLDIRELFMLAVATSIDALAVGITFAFLKVNILPAVTIIGIITFVISFAGVGIGHQFGRKYEKSRTCRRYHPYLYRSEDITWTFGYSILEIAGNCRIYD